MNKKIILIISSLLTQITYSAPISQFVTVDYEHRNYTHNRGNNNLSSILYGAKYQQASIVAKVTNGIRNVDNERDTGTEGKIDFYYNWNKNFSTKTGFSLSDGNSTFLHNELRQDFNFKPIKNLILTLGGKHTEYAKDIKVDSVSTGLTYYYDRAIISYKYSYFTSKEKKNSHGNILSIKLKDGTGSGNTQLWLGLGTGAYSYEWDDDLSNRNTNFKSVTLRREQPISKHWSVGLALGRNWYDSPIDQYTAINAKIDATYKW
ncbi:hypothetical protein B9T31_11260 [Acinetobacter sp. ANC 4558]|uniref:YaiO family outer membrane beta-barrel protein n=1 Tax=Acinetobacter sp. ANC 4558 TaxID=1977876 RepID=UPI000A342275|nr:YaiO family outer membrane beta-barrel protein [Acinetobacter sp. ANC 4558]OTG85726.1 hypothetical protein B9T31_11260 [Acinetobacter sp. ANC 4558]